MSRPIPTVSGSQRRIGRNDSRTHETVPEQALSHLEGVTVHQCDEKCDRTVHYCDVAGPSLRQPINGAAADVAFESAAIRISRLAAVPPPSQLRCLPHLITKRA
jgi:hypothetical protein